METMETLAGIFKPWPSPEFDDLFGGIANRDLEPAMAMLPLGASDCAPKPVKEGVSKDEANAAKAKLEEAGAKVDVQ